MIHHRQSLAFGLEAIDDGTAVHAAFDLFDRYPSSHRADLLGLVDLSHAALAEQTNDTVALDLAGRLRSRRNRIERLRVPFAGRPAASRGAAAGGGAPVLRIAHERIVSAFAPGAKIIDPLV